MSMQDIKTRVKREIEISKRKHERIVLRFELLVLCPCLHRNEEFLLESILQDHSVPQHLQVLSKTLLDPQVYHLFP